MEADFGAVNDSQPRSKVGRSLPSTRRIFNGLQSPQVTGLVEFHEEPKKSRLPETIKAAV